MRPQSQVGRPRLVRFLGLAIAALLTANGVVVAEQASGRDLITLGGDGLGNAREAIARLKSTPDGILVSKEVFRISAICGNPAFCDYPTVQ